MFRQIVNKIKRRKKLLDERFSLQETLNLLNRLNDNIRVNISYQEELRGFYSERFPLLDTIDFIINNFRGENSSYNDIRYRFYESKSDERHHINLTLREKNISLKEASIDFVIKKN